MPTTPTAEYPRITETGGAHRHGEVIGATPDGITVVWDTGHCVHYGAAQVTSGRYLFTIPGSADVR